MMKKNFLGNFSREENFFLTNKLKKEREGKKMFELFSAGK